LSTILLSIVTVYGQVAQIKLAWDAPVLVPYLEGVYTTETTGATDPVDLTTQGTSDWIHFGDTTLSRKATGGSQISSWSMIGPNQAARYFDDARPISWTDGTPPITTSTNNINGIWVSGAGFGFRITAPADTSLRSITFYCGNYNAAAHLKVSLSDGSVPIYTNDTLLGYASRNYTLTYRASMPNQTIIIEWTMISGLQDSSVSINGASLRGGTPDYYNLYRAQTNPPPPSPPPTPVPPPYNYARVNLVPITGLAYTDLTVTKGFTYMYTVRTSAMGTESVNSNEISATVPSGPPPNPAGAPKNLRIMP
jgi:hypothetical protein